LKVNLSFAAPWGWGYENFGTWDEIVDNNEEEIEDLTEDREAVEVDLENEVDLYPDPDGGEDEENGGEETQAVETDDFEEDTDENGDPIGEEVEQEDRESVVVEEETDEFLESEDVDEEAAEAVEVDEEDEPESDNEDDIDEENAEAVEVDEDEDSDINGDGWLEEEAFEVDGNEDENEDEDENFEQHPHDSNNPSTCRQQLGECMKYCNAPILKKRASDCNADETCCVLTFDEVREKRDINGQTARPGRRPRPFVASTAPPLTA